MKVDTINEDPGEELSNKPPVNKKSAIWTEFYENSTLHGLRNMIVAKYFVLKLVWLVLVLLALGWLIYSAVGSVERYLSYPTNIDIRAEEGEGLPFPAITICSQNFADKYKIYAKDNDILFRYYSLNISACAATADVRAGAPCGHALACAFVRLDVLEGDPIINCTPSYQKIIKQALKKSNVTFDLMEFIYTFGESWEDILKFCFHGLNQNSCYNLNIFKKAIKSDRLCHTLNGDTNKSLSFYSEAPGSIGGITLMLKNRRDHYFYPRFVEGFVVYIHQKGAGFGDNEINVLPGKFTSIAIESEKTELLEEKDGGDCQKRTLKAYKTYTQKGCYDECISNNIKQKCGCRPGFSAVYNDSLMCTGEEKDCEQNNLIPDIICDCPVACKSINYKTSVSYGAMLRKATGGVTQILPFPDYSEKDSVAILVFYSSHRVVTYEQKRTFGIISLLGEMGGNMGLLLGCSAITLAEFLFFFVSLLTSCFRKRDENAIPEV